MDYVRLSKVLCFILRHRPEALGLTLDVLGFADIDDIVEGFSKQGKIVNRMAILEAVAKDDKQRFVLSGDGLRIRATQGHSFPVSMDAFTQDTPPEYLYHGTAEGNLESIFKQGLNPQSRQHVHLSDHIETARLVGIRYKAKGGVRIFLVNTPKMVEDGVLFYRSVNGVWLVDHVPAKYLQLM